MHHRDSAAERPFCHPAVRAALQVLAATLAMFAPVSAQAQLLQAQPLQWLALMPAAPAPALQVGAPPELSGLFLKGRFLIGVNMTRGLTPDRDLRSQWHLSPVIRNTPRRTGWGPSFGLSGYRGDIDVPIDGRRMTIGEVKIHPIMAGISYSIGGGRLRTSFGVVGGYAFSSARITAALPSGTTASIDVSDAWVVRPNIGLTYALRRRLALIGSVGYVYTNPRIAVNVGQQGQAPGRVSGSFRSDYVNISVGTAISIF
jgi:hypothetical protein